MSQLSELQQKLADQKSVVDGIASQAAGAAGEELRLLVRKHEQATRSAQAIQHDLDATLNRVQYLRQAERLAQENLAVVTRHIAATRLVDPKQADALERGREAGQKEIDGIVREIVKLGAPEFAA